MIALESGVLEDDRIIEGVAVGLTVVECRERKEKNREKKERRSSEIDLLCPWGRHCFA